jgi:predicted nuclease with TOPRIM domain
MPTKTNLKDKVAKRSLNTLAARRYRQKRVDQMNDLETVLKETQTERDELKVRVARLEGELEAFKGLLKR